MLRSYGPGKYDRIIDQYVDSVSLEGFAAESIGESTGFGHYALVETSSVLTDHSDITKEEREFLASHPWAIVGEDNDGFVSVEYFGSEREARARFGYIESQYDAYCDDDEESEV